MIIETTDHNGYYNDGNSHYWDKTTTIDTIDGITTLETVETSYGQAGDYKRYSLTSHLTRKLSTTAQREIRALLAPFTDLKAKYPARNTFTYFTAKQRYFLTGRLQKAITIADIAESSDYHFTDCLSDVFVLPHYGLIIKIYAGAQDRYSHFKVSISSTIDDRDSDYWY